MKLSDKAYREFMRVFNKTHVSLEAQIMASLTAAYAAQFHPSEDYAGLVDRLNMLDGNETQWSAVWEIAEEAADALEALLAVNAELSVAFKERDQAIAERDALKNELIDYKDAAASEADFANEQTEKYRKLQSERDALLARLAPEAMLEGARAAIEAMRPIIEAADKEDSFTLESNARLAPVEAIESDKDDPTREYIPLPGGWEIQTKGKGSSYRLLDKKTGERHMILAGDAPFVQEFFTRMAKEINASAQVRPVAPVEDETLVEMAAHFEAKFDGWPFNVLERLTQDLYRLRARDFLSAVRPHIEAAEYEAAARFIEENVFNYSSGDQNYWSPRKGDNSHGLEYAREFREKAAAIRSGK